MATTMHPVTSLVFLINRLALGVYLAAAGGQGLYQRIKGEAIRDSLLNLRPTWVPDLLERPLDYALPVLAVVAGLLLAVGAFTRSAALTAAAVVAVVMVTLMQAHGLGGGGARPIHHSVVLLKLALLLAVLGPGAWSVDVLLRKRMLS